MIEQFPRFRPGSVLRRPVSLLALLAATACAGPFDPDIRGRLGGPLDTSHAAVAATEPRPEPDDRGVISYPNYQVAVARRGDTLADVAQRVGLPPEELAAYNGVQTGDPLRRGEIVALPRRVSEPTAETGAKPSTPTGAITSAPLGQPSQVDVTTLASDALDAAPSTPPQPAASPAPAGRNDAVEPVRHRVQRGETAYTIARLYNVSPRALADWNGLDANFTLREGQYLLIPIAAESAAPAASGPAPQSPVSAPAQPAAVAVTRPGSGSPTPTPPSATKPLPVETPQPAAAPAPKPAAPAAPVGETTRAASNARMTMPVEGNIIREYAKGRNDGIDISAPAGTAVRAADSGTVAAITRNTEDVPILVIKHAGDLLTVYTHINEIRVKKGDTVTRGQTIGKVQAGDPARMHFEVRDGFDSVDPMSYLR
ncbi:peptidoglycan DD-metalloendopeptidase family protein [Roseivivax sp. CAU 1761]